MDPREQYLDRFYDAVDLVASGRAGAVCEDRRLQNGYRSDYAPAIMGFLSDDDERVRCEVIDLLAMMRERSAESAIRELYRHDTQRVRDHCMGFIKNLEEDDSRIPGLLDDMEHTHGDEYFRAAKALAKIARAQDVDRVRAIYGQTEGEMREAAGSVLEGILERNPPLRRKRQLIMSQPVYPDEAAFDRFLDRSVEYIDVRYRENVHPAEKIKLSTYNNVASALEKMRIRLYNEADNLEYYGADMGDRHLELTELLAWATRDLAGKEVLMEGAEPSKVCPGCGGMMVKTKNGWACPDGCVLRTGFLRIPVFQ